MNPRVGEESDEYRAVCVYAPRLGQPQCGAPATVHVLVNDADHGVVALASCDDHAPIARAAAPLILEHAYKGFCGFPGTIWDDVTNRCVLDDSGPDRSARSAAEVALVAAP